MAISTIYIRDEHGKYQLNESEGEREREREVEYGLKGKKRATE